MSVLLIEDHNQVRTLTLNRPERRNALLPELMDALTEAILGAEAAGARVLLLAGAGDAFSSGMDLSVLQQMSSLTPEQHEVEAARLSRMFRTLWECPLPTIALVQGPAIAGGTGLATLCDFTLAAPEARFGYTEVRIGFIPAVVSTYLTLQLGAKAAGSLLLSGRIFTAEEAHTLGLVTELIPRDQLSTRAAALAEELKANSPQGMRATKQLLRAQHSAWLDAALALSLDASAASRQTADFREGLAAFLAKRKPHWT